LRQHYHFVHACVVDISLFPSLLASLSCLLSLSSVQLHSIDLLQVVHYTNSNQGIQAKPITQIHMYTFNVMGLHKSRLDFQQALRCHKPDVLVLTEAKLQDVQLTT